MKYLKVRDIPRISIGLPVFNGENYIEEALDSILAQTYPNFEVIISDNASTDNTEHICRKYASEDKRVRYYRNEKNIGASKNHNRIFWLSSSKYFKWAAHDDILDPKFLFKCIKILEEDESVVLCFSKIHRIDENGEINGSFELKGRFRSRKAHERFGYFLRFSYPCGAVFGVIRSSALRKTPLISNYIGSDRNLLAELSLIGRIYQIPEYLFFFRKHTKSYSTHYQTLHTSRAAMQENLTWWDPTRARGRLIYTLNLLEYLRSLRRVPLNRLERLLCYAQIARWLIVAGWIRIFQDIVMYFTGRSVVIKKLASVIEYVDNRTENWGEGHESNHSRCRS